MDPARAHVVGSLLRPPELLNAWRAFRGGALAAAEFKTIEDRAVDAAIALQERAGIDVITDGEQRRLAFGDVFGRSVTGIESSAPEKIGGSPFWRGGDDQSRQVELSSPTGGHIVAKLRRAESKACEEFAYARARATKPLKVTLPSPTLLIASWSPERSTRAYRHLGEALDDVVEILREEVHALARLGCAHVQFDAPETTFAIEGESSMPMRLLRLSRESFCAEVVKRLNEVAVEPGIEFSVHFCRGNARGHWHSAGGYGAISKLVFPHLGRFRYVRLEYDSERAGSFEPLADLPRSCCAVLGLITTKTGQLEDRRLLAARIDEAAQFFPRDRLAVSPQCGFASDAGGNPITAAEQEAKLRLVGTVGRETKWQP